MKRMFFYIALFLFMMFLLPFNGKGQNRPFLRLSPLEGTLHFTYNYERRIMPLLSTRPYYKETIGLKNAGFLIDPRILKFDWGLTFALSQEKYNRKDFKRDSDGKFINGTASFSFFRNSPLPLTFVWNRLKNNLNIGYGGHTFSYINKYQVGFAINKLFIPSIIRLEKYDRNEEWGRADRTTQRDQIRRSVIYSGNIIMDTHKLKVRYNYRDITDRIYSERSSRTHDFNLRFHYFFDPKKENTSESLISFYKRKYGYGYQNIKASQTFKFLHPYGFSSKWNYNFLSIKTSAFNSNMHTGYAAINHQLYKSVTSTVGGGLSYSQMNTGYDFSYYYDAGINYVKSLPLSGKIQLGFRQAISKNDRNIKGRIRTVIAESYVFSNGQPPFLLERNIVLSSIKVYSKENDIIYEEGTGKDFVLEKFGEHTVIVRNPLGRIEPDQIVFVDYKFITSPSMKFQIKTRSFNSSLSFGWLNLYYNTNNHSQDFLEGEPESTNFLQNLYIKNLGLKLVFNGPNYGSSLSFEQKNYKSRELTYQQVNLQNASYFRPGNDLMLSADLQVFRMKYLDLNDKMLMYLAKIRLNWQATSVLFINGFASTLSRDQTIREYQLNNEFGADIHWGWRTMWLKISYRYQYWNYGEDKIRVGRFKAELEKFF